MRANVLSDTLARLDTLTNWERRPREDMKVGLEPIQDLMQRLGNPHKTFRVVVASTAPLSTFSAANSVVVPWRL